MLSTEVRKIIEKYNMIQIGESVVVAVSGGPDSVAMLHVLNSLSGLLGFKIHIAHLNHMIRKDSKKDLKFVERLAKKKNLPITIREINIPDLREGDSIEQVARRVRLDFLFDVARGINTKKIALGHTKDDQVETILMRLIRGTGLHGLSGILPIRKIDGFTVIRPLIELKREDIIRYLKNFKIKSMFDVTNLDTKFLRNRIRKELIPLLEKRFNPNIKETLYSLAKVAQKDYDYLSIASRRSFRKIQSKNYKNKIELDLNKLKKLHKSMQGMVLRLALEELQGNTRRLTYKHWEELEDLIYHRHSNSIVDLPRQVSILKNKDRFIISLRKS